ARPLACHLPSRHPSQLVVDDRNELLQRGLVASFPSGEELRDVMVGDIGHRQRPRFVGGPLSTARPGSADDVRAFVSYFGRRSGPSARAPGIVSCCPAATARRSTGTRCRPRSSRSAVTGTSVA